MAKKKKRTFRLFGVEFPLFQKCPDCGKDDSCKWQTYGYTPRCPECQIKLDKEQSKQRTGGTFFHKKYKDVQAFGYDKKTGKPMAIDTKGKHIDPSETRYNLQRDPHGWKATGKKVRERDERGGYNYY